MTSRFKHAVVLPASDPDAPHSDDYDVDLRPQAGGVDFRTSGEMLPLPIWSRITVGYTAGAREENAGEAMVVTGTTEDVGRVLRHAGYRAIAAVPQGSGDANCYSIEDIERLLDRVDDFDVRTVETRAWTFEIELASPAAVAYGHSLSEGNEVVQPVASALARGILQAMQEQERTLDGPEGTILESLVRTPFGPDGCRVSIGHPAAQETLDALCVSEETDRASIVETLVAFHFALEELGLKRPRHAGV